MKKNYYDILGLTEEEQNLPENQFQEICKKKYRSLCLKWHPDRWVGSTDEEKKTAEKNFKEISEAYHVLSNNEKRRQYDSGVDDTQGFDGFDPFEEMMRRAAGMRGFGDFFHGFGGGRGPVGHKGADVEAFTTMTFTEAMNPNGILKEITVKKKVKCPDCNGTGSEDGQEHKCPHCNGTGMTSRTERQGNSFVMYQQPCEHCHGTGKQIDKPCKKCNGTGFVDVEEKKTVKIPAGMRNGMTIVYGGQGEEGTEGYPNGNLLLHITITQDIPGYFESVDNDLNIYHEEKVNFVDALLGTTIIVKCPDGSDWQIRLRECTQPGEHFTKTDAGYIHSNGYMTQKGDYVVIIKYDVPSKLTKEQKKALEEYKKVK